MATRHILSTAAASAVCIAFGAFTTIAQAGLLGGFGGQGSGTLGGAMQGVVMPPAANLGGQGALNGALQGGVGNLPSAKDTANKAAEAKQGAASAAKSSFTSTPSPSTPSANASANGSFTADGSVSR